MRSLIRHLPSDSSTGVALNGEKAWWGVTDLLLANVIDALQWANYQRSDPKKAQKPDPFPRPGVASRGPSTRSKLTSRQVHERLRAQLRRRRR